jgi:hypothetical protein
LAIAILSLRCSIGCRRARSSARVARLKRVS